DRDGIGRNRPRSDACDRARGGSQAERNLHAARRGFLERRISPRPHRACLERAACSDAPANRRVGHGIFRSCRGFARRRRRRVDRGSRQHKGGVADAGIRSSGRRCYLPDPEFLCVPAAPRRAAWGQCRSAPSSAKGDPDAMSERIHAVAARRLFDGVTLRENSAVVIEGDTITAVLPRPKLARAIPRPDLPADAWLAPGFIDIQVNGGGDVLFNDEPTPDAIRSIAAAHRKFGTTSLLPALISDSPEKMAAACR